MAFCSIENKSVLVIPMTYYYIAILRLMILDYKRHLKNCKKINDLPSF